MATLLGAIADDFTGATDLAGLLARSGRSSLFTDWGAGCATVGGYGSV